MVSNNKADTQQNKIRKNCKNSVSGNCRCRSGKNADKNGQSKNNSETDIDGESKRKGRLVGKDSAFIIVEFSGDPSLIGTFQNVRITEARNWAVLGELVEEEQA